jgi:hypothetical protein
MWAQSAIAKAIKPAGSVISATSMPVMVVSRSADEVDGITQKAILTYVMSKAYYQMSTRFFGLKSRRNAIFEHSE